MTNPLSEALENYDRLFISFYHESRDTTITLSEEAIEKKLEGHDSRLMSDDFLERIRVNAEITALTRELKKRENSEEYRLSSERYRSL